MNPAHWRTIVVELRRRRARAAVVLAMSGALGAAYRRWDAT